MLLPPLYCQMANWCPITLHRMPVNLRNGDVPKINLKLSLARINGMAVITQEVFCVNLISFEGITQKIHEKSRINYSLLSAVSSVHDFLLPNNIDTGISMDGWRGPRWKTTTNQRNSGTAGRRVPLHLTAPWYGYILRKSMVFNQSLQSRVLYS